MASGIADLATATTVPVDGVLIAVVFWRQYAERLRRRIGRR
jgi:hypothetical protein